jgi:dolichyl-phosphate-mannose--protein O-mannosyl transferase
VLWWAGLVAIVYLLYRWAGRRDWRAGAVLAGIAAVYLPWLAYTERTIFFFYAVAFVPFLVLAVTMMLGALIGDPADPPNQRMARTLLAGTVVILVVINFVYLHPILTAQPLPMEQWRERMWFNSWI